MGHDMCVNMGHDMCVNMGCRGLLAGITNVNMVHCGLLVAGSPGMLNTGTPLTVMAWTGMLLVPAPHRAIALTEFGTLGIRAVAEYGIP